MIAGDEARHEEAYKRIFAKLIEADTDRAVCSFASMMRQKIVMPARLMSDGTDRDLFSQFAVVAQRSGVYTILDYADNIGHLVDYWGIAALKGLSAEGRKAQDYLCGLTGHFLKKADKTRELVEVLPREPFSWIFERTA
jgi:acyl-[acyl-carrier-protein] desaturase